MQLNFSIQAVAIAHTPFLQKFSIPRQASLVDIPAQIELLAPYNQMQAVAGLEQVSHIWISFLFDQHINKNKHLSVRPPRLGGKQKLGVFATRSSFRPNDLGLSLVKLEKIEQTQKGIVLHVLGLDVLDKTPIVDIKPYLPYADCRVEATNLIAEAAPEKSLKVSWHAAALEQLIALKGAQAEKIQAWISQLISYDPRAGHQKKQASAKYAVFLFALDVHWQISDENCAEIICCTPMLEPYIDS